MSLNVRIRMYKCILPLVARSQFTEKKMLYSSVYDQAQQRLLLVWLLLYVVVVSAASFKP